MSKLCFHKKITEYLNQSRDATQFWHRYEKVTGRKTNNTVEPILDSNSSTYIFDDEVISNRLHDYHIAKSASSLNCDDSFKMSVEEKLQRILNHFGCYLIGYFPKLWKMENHIYIKKMDEQHIT